jgi:hypothetical protein
VTTSSTGAQCALHPGATAVVTCQRCGNFMCFTCSSGRTSTLCPPCRESTAPGFPFDAGADFGAIWGYAQRRWQGDLGMLSLASLIFGVITGGGTAVTSVFSTLINAIIGAGGEGGVLTTVVGFVVGQVFGAVVNAVVSAVALTGLYRVLLDVLQGQRADVGRMFSQLHLVPAMVGLQLLLAVVFTLPLGLLMAGAVVAAAASAGIPLADLNADTALTILPRLAAVFALVGPIIVALSIAVLPVTIFAVPELIVGQCGPVEAIARSWRLGSGQRMRLLGYGFVSGLVVMVGALACFIGLVPALPLAYLVELALFLALRKSSGLPPAGL